MEDLPASVGVDLFAEHGKNPRARTDVLVTAGGYETRLGFSDPVFDESVVVASSFEENQITELRLYPIEHRHSKRPANRRVLRPALAPQARATLGRLQIQSRPFGTEITIENDVGVNRGPFKHGSIETEGTIMEKQQLFERTEFLARLAAVKDEMARRGIDVLLISEPPNMNYLTGYDAYSYYVPQFVIVSLNGDEPIWIGRFMDRVSAVMTTYLADDNVRSYPDKYVQSATFSAYDVMAETVKQIGGEKARIGAEMGGYYYSARAHSDLMRALPHAEFVDADLLVNWIRVVKSPAEIALMRQAGKIADAMMERAIDTIAPGVRECDVAAAVYHQMAAGTPEFGGAYMCSPPFLCVGERAVAPHAAWTDKPLPASTIINLELFGNRHRYQVNLSRSISLGKPTPAYQNLSEIMVEALNAALDSVRPGRTCAEVEGVFRQSLARHGLEKEARLGYSIGLGYPPGAVERTASLRKGDETVLKSGMCFHMMPGLWLDDVGITITQSFAVADDGHEPLSSIPRKLFVK
ncbi:M24 family metallopeptidase [Mesorhizobium sp. B4-1-4]|uniref:M24 family metallopeptidase n=1 Tax=Mesorhizobium sp. B4-1-4 TaxID=2589888 RepID=UPI001D017A3E|nr:Xaa-Pro peptidase family protein [Mesorhizobium sp. B4-1-4]UCI31971.1 Xaa-Pro peptidase family protein [Mesorhizobium sp. B4-1-4]